MYKHVLSIVLAVVLLTACMSVSAAEKENIAGNELGLKILNASYNEKENIIVSPISLALALSMVSEGASGTTREELLSAIGSENGIIAEEVIEELRLNGLQVANAAFINEDVQLKDNYQSIIHQSYDGEFFDLTENAVKDINQWVDKHTNGLIQDFVSQVPKDTLLVLANAVAMDMEWVHKFKKTSTWEDVFHAPEKDNQIEFMHTSFNREEIEYAEISGTQVIKLPYRHSDMYMLVACPEQNGMEAFLAELSDKGMSLFEGLSPFQGRELELSLPKFDITAKSDLVPVLQKYGVNKMFTDEAELFDISDVPLKVSSVFQKARIQVDEEGTKAAAATAIMLDAMAAYMEPDEYVQMDVDRPFVVLIVDGRSGIICFAAVITNPAAK